mgnify:CR=1 FL=1
MKYSTFSNQNLIVRIRKQAVKGMPYHSSGLTIHAWNEDIAVQRKIFEIRMRYFLFLICCEVASICYLVER